MTPNQHPARVALVLGCLGGAQTAILMTWLHPHGVLTVAVVLASVLLALTVGFVERSIPVPRQEEDRDENADG